MREQRTSNVWTYAPMGALACGVALLLAPGARGSPDSTNYLNAALHLAAGHGYVTSTVDAFGPAVLEPLTVFPPGLSLALVPWLWLGLDPRTAFRLLLGLSYVAFALATYALLRVSLPERLQRLGLPITLAIIVQAPVCDALNAALSDLLGAAAALTAVAFCLRPKAGKPFALALGTLLGASIWVRWANLYIAFGVGLSLVLVSQPTRPLRARLLTAIEVAAATLFVVLPLWLRNQVMTHTFMGPRTQAASAPLEQMGLAIQGLGAWFASAHESLDGFPTLSGAHTALGLVLGFVALLAVAQARDEKTRSLAVIAASYVVFMVLSSSTVIYDPLSDSRFWLPVLPLGTAAWLRSIATIDWPRSLRLLAATAWALVVAHATVQSGRTIVTLAGREPRHSQYFAEVLDSSKALRRALNLHDAGVCELATDDEFALLPRIGTRLLRKVETEALPSLSRRPGKALCLVLLGDAGAQAHDTPFAVAHAAMLDLRARGRAWLQHADSTGELWLISGNQGSPRISLR